MSPEQKIMTYRKVLPILAVYFALTLTGILNHEIWLDEAQHFLIARDSSSLNQLFHNMRYDGHVQLWNYLLFFITHYISDNVLAMQLFHLLIINAAVFVFLRFAPFSIVVKILVLAGYYFLFEYALLSRNYALGILFLFIACSLIDSPKRMLWLGLLCFLMCGTHLFFLFAATGIVLYVLYDSLVTKHTPAGLFVFLSLYTGGVLMAFLQMRQVPPDNTYFHPGDIGLRDMKNPSYSIYGITRGFLPLQNVNDPHPWGTFMFDKMNRFVKLLLSVALFFYPYFMLRKSRKALLFYYVPACLLMVFFVLTHMMANRYYGMFFVYLLAALWLMERDPAVAGTHTDISSKPLFKEVFYGILAVQAIAGIYAYMQDVARPFSLGKGVTQYLRSSSAADDLVVVDGYGGGPCVSAYLRRPVYYLDIDAEGSYCIWKKAYFPQPRPRIEDEMKGARGLKQMDKFVLVSTRKITEQRIGADSVEYALSEMKEFEGGIILPDYYLYSAKRMNR